MTAPLVPSELLGPVIAFFNPQRVILFGSTARGEAHCDSDIDLLVVLDDDAPVEKLTATAVYQARAEYHAPVDIIPCRASKLYSRARVIGSFAYVALREGVTVYERG